MLRDTSLVDLITGIVSYRHAFGEEYDVSLLHARIHNIVEDMICSDILSLKSWFMYSCFPPVTRLLLKQGTVSPLHKEPKMEDAGTSNLRITHVDNATIYSSAEVDEKLMPQTANVFVNNPAKPSLFHSVSLYKRLLLFWQELQQAYHSHAGFYSFPFAAFLEFEVPITPSRSIPIKVQFSSTIRVCDHYPCDTVGFYIAWAITCKCRLLSEIGRKLDIEEGTAKQPVVIGIDARQETKRSL